jgi:hypothetical protein
MALCVLAALPWVGCITKPAIRGPVATPPQAPPSKGEEALSQLKGTWESQGKNGIKKMIFAPGGQLTFEGGLDYYNPARWDLDADREELTITLPGADVDKLQIFQLYVGQGVKRFNPSQKQIIYHFDPQTWTLNFAGWEYTKTDKAAAEPLAEPVLK